MKKFEILVKLQLQYTTQLFANLTTPSVTISGGLAWHLMAEPHPEDLLYHDHKDVDLIASNSECIRVLKALGFVRQHTKYSNPKNSKFVRYTKHHPRQGVKIVFDVFFEHIESIDIDGFKVVHPALLKQFYRSNRWQKNLEILKPEYAKLLEVRS